MTSGQGFHKVIRDCFLIFDCDEILSGAVGYSWKGIRMCYFVCLNIEIN